MANKHPYISSAGGISGAITQFRKSFPQQINSDTLKKLGIAPSNESYVINILRFIGAIDETGSRTPQAEAAFSKHEQNEFEGAFREMIKSAYSDLFDLYGEDVWNLDMDKLISFFRSSDKSTDLVGRRQANTFQVLASFAGHGDIPVSKTPSTLKVSSEKQTKLKKTKASGRSASIPNVADLAIGSESKKPPPDNRDVGLTVRIEVNLPAAGDQETYDKIFRSIRENLLNGR
jgi:Family of unknown function (DUF5343)